MALRLERQDFDAKEIMAFDVDSYVSIMAVQEWMYISQQ
jgi:hypothetical protein